MINISSLEKFAELNELDVRIKKRNLTKKDIDYHMNNRIYEIFGYDQSKFCNKVIEKFYNLSIWYESGYSCNLLYISLKE